MKKKFLKRAAAFAVASLMAVGVITVLPDECLPQIGSVVSAEETEAGGVAINAVNFPDEIFRQYISENFDKDKNASLSSSEISSANYINVNDKGVQNLKGVEYFTSLIFLECEKNQLTSLDISNNTALTTLCCYRNQLTSLDVSNNIALEELWCDGNQLISLDLRNNTALTLLYCGDNQLTSLDLRNNTALKAVNGNFTKFSCDNNKFSVDVQCGIYNYENLPTSFDISKASNWQGATLKDDMLTEIDGSGYIKYDYDCGNNLTAKFRLEYNRNGYNIHCYNDGVITIEPTEEAEGEKTYTCSGCDEKLDFSTHTEDSGMVTVEPTETTEGEKIYKCTVCGHTTRTDVIAKLEHVHNKGNELVSDETGHWYTCSGCDEKLDFSTHMEDSGTITVEPTVTTEGQKVYKCTVCGYTTRIETIAKLGGGSNNPTGPSRPSQPAEPSKPTQPSNPSQPQQPETNGSETNISVKKGWGNVVKEINKANDNSKINVDMGNSTNVPKNVMNAIKGKNVDIVLDMGDGITWTINGKDVTDPQSVDFSVTKKKNQIPEDMISDPSNTIPLVFAHNGNFGCSATLSIDLKDNDNKIANLYYYNTKTKELEFVDSSVIVNGKASLVFTHASDWAIVISDTSAEYEDVSSAAGAYETDDNSQAPLCIIIIILAALGFSHIIIMKRLTKHKR